MPTSGDLTWDISFVEGPFTALAREQAWKLRIAAATKGPKLYAYTRIGGTKRAAHTALAKPAKRIRMKPYDI